MGNITTLLGLGQKPREYPETSLEAYRSVTPEERRAQCLAILEFMQEGDATADEVEAALGYGHQRFSELKRAGLIESTGVKRRTRMGKPAFSYRLTKKVIPEVTVGNCGFVFPGMKAGSGGGRS
jgi:hypothetical protein